MVNGKKILKKRVKLFTLTETLMMVSGVLIKNLEKALLIMSMEMPMKENGMMTQGKEKV